MVTASASTSIDAANFSDARRPLRVDLDVDVCVVGAGLAGLSIALEAARLGARVAVLERRSVGWAASSHQLGSVLPGFSLPLDDLIARVGLGDAKAMWALSQAGVDAVARLRCPLSIPVTG
jgi:glycine/D-amino acid oxidase-like deaminating enzyme